MNNITEKRKNNLISLTYFAVFALIYYFFVKYAFWVCSPFIIALVIAMALQHPINFISEKTHIKKKPLSVVLVLLIVAVLIGLIVLIGYLAGTEFYNFAKYLSGKLTAVPAVIESVQQKLEALTQRLPGAIGNSVTDAIHSIADKITSLVQESETVTEESVSKASTFDFSVLMSPLGGIWSTAKQIPAVLTAILIGIIACFFITSDYEGFTSLIKNSLSDEHVKTVSKAKHVIIDVLGKWCKSYALILFVTFCEVFVGLYILKFAKIYTGGYIFVIALCTALLDILPVFGTGTVIVPWAVISLFGHKIGMAIGLVVIYVLITIIRQILEPKLVSANVGMHPVVTLMSMYIGIQAFGVFGIFLLPITVIVIKTLNEEGVIHLWAKKNALSDSDNNQPGGDSPDTEKDASAEADEPADTEAVSEPEKEKEQVSSSV